MFNIVNAFLKKNPGYTYSLILSLDIDEEKKLIIVSSKKKRIIIKENISQK
jgi:hypothetical protein